MKIIDISQELLSCNVYPGDPVPEADKISSMENGEIYNLSKLSMCAHNGTHIDAPSHFIKDGKTIDQLECDNFVGDCYVLQHNGDLSGSDAVQVLDKARSVGAGERILIAGKATVTEDAARVFADAGVKLIGNESQTVGSEGAPMAVHRILLGAEVVLLEGIVLTDVSEGKYFLSALPLNIKGFEGAPCRAYIIEK